jgi:hypothetical protein
MPPLYISWQHLAENEHAAEVRAYQAAGRQSEEVFLRGCDDTHAVVVTPLPVYGFCSPAVIISHTHTRF